MQTPPQWSVSLESILHSTTRMCPRCLCSCAHRPLVAPHWPWNVAHRQRPLSSGPRHLAASSPLTSALYPMLGAPVYKNCLDLVACYVLLFLLLFFSTCFIWPTPDCLYGLTSKVSFPLDCCGRLHNGPQRHLGPDPCNL